MSEVISNSTNTKKLVQKRIRNRSTRDKTRHLWTSSINLTVDEKELFHQICIRNVGTIDTISYGNSIVTFLAQLCARINYTSKRDKRAITLTTSDLLRQFIMQNGLCARDTDLILLGKKNTLHGCTRLPKLAIIDSTKGLIFGNVSLVCRNTCALTDSEAVAMRELLSNVYHLTNDTEINIHYEKLGKMMMRRMKDVRQRTKKRKCLAPEINERWLMLKFFITKG